MIGSASEMKCVINKACIMHLSKMNWNMGKSWYRNSWQDLVKYPIRCCRNICQNVVPCQCSNWHQMWIQRAKFNLYRIWWVKMTSPGIGGCTDLLCSSLPPTERVCGIFRLENDEGLAYDCWNQANIYSFILCHDSQSPSDSTSTNTVDVK